MANHYTNSWCRPPMGRIRPQDAARRHGNVGNPNGVSDPPPKAALEKARLKAIEHEERMEIWNGQRWKLERRGDEWMTHNGPPPSESLADLMAFLELLRFLKGE